MDKAQPTPSQPDRKAQTPKYEKPKAERFEIHEVVRGSAGVSADIFGGYTQR